MKKENLDYNIYSGNVSWFSYANKLKLDSNDVNRSLINYDNKLSKKLSREVNLK